MLIKYFKTKNKDDDNFKDDIGLIEVNNFDYITAERKDSTDPRNYIFLLTDSNEKKYLIGEMNEPSGNEEWGLYTANIYMNYIREYLNGNCSSLPDLHDIYVIIASSSSCFEPFYITTKENLSILEKRMITQDKSENLDLIRIIKSAQFDYNLVKVK